MPAIKLERIISFTSEDPKYPAENLIKSDLKKKWKCLSVGEKRACISFQLEKSCVISNVDIGNENSALIEVSVGKSCVGDDFEVLIPTSSFMSPFESLHGHNTNRVRMFSGKDFLKPVSEQKWDQIKVVCTQPFNKNVKYGLSFIVVRSSEASDEENSQNPMFGKFSLKDEDDEGGLSIGSLFAKKKKINEEPLRGAAAIREASRPSALAKAENKSAAEFAEKISKLRKGTSLLESVNDSPRSRMLKTDSKLTDEGEKRSFVQNDKLLLSKVETKQNESKNINVKRYSPVSKPRDAKKQKIGESSTKVQNPKHVRQKPFEKLLEGVVLVVSGYQNPLRSILRGKALEMGAKYCPDWNNTCTHLICAFLNTPKYQQVKGKGKIVNKSWIEECYSRRKRLPWRRFALDRKEASIDESEEEILEEAVAGSATEESSNQLQDKDGNESDVSDQREDSESDTEDEIERIKSNSQNSDADPDLYNKDTDVDSDESQQNPSSSLPFLPDFYNEKVFCLHFNIKQEARNLLQRYIVAYKGILSKNLDSTVNYFIVPSKNDDDVQEIKEEYPGLRIVTENWVWKCNELESLAPTSDFEL